MSSNFTRQRYQRRAGNLHVHGVSVGVVHLVGVQRHIAEIKQWTNQVGEINTNIDTLVQHQFPSLFASFLASTGPNTFTVHGDSAPPFYLAKKGVGPLGQTDPDTRTFERTIAGLSWRSTPIRPA